LVAPIIKDVQKKNVAQIANDSKALIEKARNNKLSPDDLEGGCITVSNLGAFGIESFIPVVVPGQCSILGIGQITDTCVPDNGDIKVRKLMNMTLSVDHKVANGAYAAQFLDYVRKLLEDTSTFA
ncbi:MAG: 2-oxo acid dehydrogenase subunit E2, partial [Planctomycetota bacterium]